MEHVLIINLKHSKKLGWQIQTVTHAYLHLNNSLFSFWQIKWFLFSKSFIEYVEWMNEYLLSEHIEINPLNALPIYLQVRSRDNRIITYLQVRSTQCITYLQVRSRDNRMKNFFVSSWPNDLFDEFSICFLFQISAKW